MFSKNNHCLNNNSKNKNSILTISIAILVAILSATPPAHSAGIKCFVCNSALDPRCGDPFNNRTIELVDCDQYMPGRNATLCRKIFQKVALGSTTDERIIRSCGYELDSPGAVAMDAETEGKGGGNSNNRNNDGEIITPETSSRCFKRAGTFEVMVTYCSCATDGCNHAGNLGGDSVVVMVMIGVVSSVSGIIFSRLF